MCEYIRQTNERTCGQTCIAMISGKTENDIVELIGHAKGTKTKEIISTLSKLGIKNSQKLIRFCHKNPLPVYGIVKTIHKNKKQTTGNWHWILKYGNRFIDPSGSDNIYNLKIISFIWVHGYYA